PRLKCFFATIRLNVALVVAVETCDGEIVMPRGSPDGAVTLTLPEKAPGLLTLRTRLPAKPRATESDWLISAKSGAAGAGGASTAENASRFSAESSVHNSATLPSA